MHTARDILSTITQHKEGDCMKQWTKQGFQMTCPLIKGVIDSDLCIEVQECIEGNIPVSLEYEDFLQPEDCERICQECKYHI